MSGTSESAFVRALEERRKKKKAQLSIRSQYNAFLCFRVLAFAFAFAFVMYAVVGEQLFVSLDQETIVLVDTHCHNDSGAVIALGKCARLDDFVSVCQELISADATTYGNFVFVEF